MTLTKELHKTKTLKIPKLLVLVEKVILQQLMSKLKIISEGGCPGYKLRVGAVVSSSLSCTVIITIVIILSIIIFKFKKWKKNKKERGNEWYQGCGAIESDQDLLKYWKRWWSKWWTHFLNYWQKKTKLMTLDVNFFNYKKTMLCMYIVFKGIYESISWVGKRQHYILLPEIFLYTIEKKKLEMKELLL